jgi:hypothetical protein
MGELACSAQHGFPFLHLPALPFQKSAFSSLGYLLNGSTSSSSERQIGPLLRDLYVEFLLLGVNIS